MRRLVWIIIFALLASQAQAQALQSITNYVTHGGGPLSLNPGWTWDQDVLISNCSGFSCTINTDCTTSAPTCLTPTVAGSAWAVFLVNENNVTICPMSGGTGNCAGKPGVTGGGGTWALCPGTGVGGGGECHNYNATIDENVDGAYNLTGTTGTVGGITVNTTGTLGSFSGFYFAEVSPPATYTASYDKGGTAVTTTNCNPCTGVDLSAGISGNTDAIVQIADANDPAAWNSYSSPYITDTPGNGVALNVTSGSPPTLTQGSAAGPAQFAAIAFKSTANIFTVPTPTFALVNYTTPNNGGNVNCTPICPTIATAGTGHLLFLVYGNNNTAAATLLSISGGGTWVIPSGANTCNFHSGSVTLQCAWVLSSSSGSIIPTLAANSAFANFALYEASRTSGGFVLDSQNSASHAQTCSVVGLAPTITGTSDVVFQQIYASGGENTIQFYPLPYAFQIQNHWGNGDGSFSGSVLLNTTNTAIPAVGFPVNCATVGTDAMMAAFK